MTTTALDEPSAMMPADWLRPSVHPTYARLLCAEMVRRGHAPAQVVLGTGMAWDDLHTGQAFLSLAQLQRLVTRALRLSDDPALGLAVGWSTELSSHGALGFAAASADNLGQALALLPLFSGLRLQLASFALELDDGAASLTLSRQLHDGEVGEYVLGHITGAVLRLVQSVSGQPPGPVVTLHWPLAAAPGASALQALVADVRWHAPAWRLCVPRALLGLPTLAPDAHAHRAALRSCEEYRARGLESSMAQRVRLRLLACDGRFPRIEDMAACEHLSARTLIRRLRDEGTQYQTLLDHTRADLACWLLSTTRAPIDAIAERLGFADPSNFSRSFRRWCGCTPSVFRQRAQLPGADTLA